jgi:recombination protein RecR
VGRYSESMERLVAAFEALPGIGRRSAERLAFHVLRCPPEEALALARAIEDVRRKAVRCSACFNVAESDPCHICSDPRRDRSLLCVVEEPKDVLAIEAGGDLYHGLYHVLMGRLAPLEGVEAKDLTVDALVERVRREGVKEVILATNPTVDGDATALYVQRRLAGTGARVTRIARGVPAGSTLEYASRTILADALAGRSEVQ